MWKAIMVSAVILSVAAMLTVHHAGFDRAGDSFVRSEKERRLTITGTRAPFYLRAIIAERDAGRLPADGASGEMDPGGKKK